MTDPEIEKKLTAVQSDLFAYARKLTRHKERAEDLLQDANMRIWVKRELYKEDTNFLSWCKTVMRNHYLNQVVVEARMPMLTDNRFLQDQDIVDDERGHGSNFRNNIGKYLSQEANQEDYWLENRIMEAINSLPAHTALLIHKKLQGMSYDDIARPLGIKGNNARQRYFNEVKKLREELLRLGLVDENG